MREGGRGGVIIQGWRSWVERVSPGSWQPFSLSQTNEADGGATAAPPSRASSDGEQACGEKLAATPLPRPGTMFG